MDAPPRLVAATVVVAALAAVPGSAAGEPAAPKAWEAFFGYVRAVAPAGADTVELFVDAKRVRTVSLEGRRLAVRVPAVPGRHTLRLRFESRGRLLRRDEARDVWLLRPSMQRATRERSRSRSLGRKLAAIGSGYPGWAALWAHDLGSGRTAGWNSDASFPAASTVKLGVLVAALDRFGPRPERSTAWRDIHDLARWSSNIASNRLLVRLGGSEAGGVRIVQATLHRLGATSSTFTGNYRLGTSDAPRPLPLLTYRRTTAHDLGRMLLELHAAALGQRLALRRTGLSRHEARVGLGLLLSSAQTGENLGLLRPALPGVAIAQKQGWTTSLRHTAAIVYGRRGPVIVVVLTYRAEIDGAASVVLGRRLTTLLREAGWL